MNREADALPGIGIEIGMRGGEGRSLGGRRVAEAVDVMMAVALGMGDAAPDVPVWLAQDVAATATSIGRRSSFRMSVHQKRVGHRTLVVRRPTRERR